MKAKRQNFEIGFRCWNCGKKLLKGKKDYCSPLCKDALEGERDDDMKATHEGAVCELCGRTVTEAEYSSGDSDCHTAQVIAEEDFGKVDPDGGR